jgi:hypothetical protein
MRMSITIELTEAEELRIREQAAALGLNEVEYARRRLVGEADDLKPQTGAEALAFWEREGVLGLFSDRPDSPEFARQLRSEAESRGAGTT